MKDFDEQNEFSETELDFLDKILDDLSDEQRQRLADRLFVQNNKIDGTEIEKQTAALQEKQLEINEITAKLAAGDLTRAERTAARERLRELIAEKSPADQGAAMSDDDQKRLTELTDELESMTNNPHYSTAKRRQIAAEMAKIIKTSQQKTTSGTPFFFPDNCSRYVGAIPFATKRRRDGGQK